MQSIVIAVVVVVACALSSAACRPAGAASHTPGAGGHEPPPAPGNAEQRPGGAPAQPGAGPAAPGAEPAPAPADPAPVAVPAVEADPARSAEVDRLVARVLGTTGTGAAVLVMRDGEVLHMKGYGYADIASGRPVTTGTVFDLASVSKQFTAVAAMMLSQRGALSMRDDVKQHVPAMKGVQTPRVVTLLDLCRHTSGFQEYFEWLDPEAADYPAFSIDQVIARLAQAPLDFPTGTATAYSNSNYTLLAKVVEVRSGKSFRQFMAEEVFGRIGMRHAAIRDRHDRAVPGLATGYSIEGGTAEPVDYPNSLYGDGNMFATIADFAAWERALRDGRLLDDQSLALAFTPGTLDDGSGIEYGCGWYADDGGTGGRVMGHGGYYYGYLSHMRRYLDEGLAVFVLTNGDRDGVSIPEDYVDGIAAIYQ